MPHVPIRSAPGCPGQVRSVQQLAQAGSEQRSEPEEQRPEERRPEERRPEERRPEERRPEEKKPREHEPLAETRERAIPLDRPAHVLDELNNRIAEVAKNITDAESREREAERKSTRPTTTWTTREGSQARGRGRETRGCGRAGTTGSALCRAAGAGFAGIQIAARVQIGFRAERTGPNG